jgi:ubiquitin-protein ligase
MSLANDHLGEIHRQIGEIFAAHPSITVEASKGQSPDQYTISYAIAGLCKNEQGEVKTSQKHTVELTIPFGFPHFPPSCKPKTEIFHPDFDPAAICLGNFWETNPSLPELIMHIGRMINGEEFTTTNSFNEEAAEWYTRNREKFPLALIEWGSTTAKDRATPAGKRDLDTLDDTDLEEDFDYLSLEIDEEENDDGGSPFPEVVAGPAIDFDQLRLLKKKRNFYALFELTEDLLETSGVAGGAARQAKEEIKRAEKLHHRAKELEDDGKADQAVRLFEEIAATVSDFPGIEADVRRMKQAAALLQELSPAAFDAGLDSPEEEFSHDFDSPTTTSRPSSRRKGKAAKPGKERSRKENQETDNGAAGGQTATSFKRSGRKNLLPILALLLIAGAGAGGAYLYFSLLNQLAAAEGSSADCKTSLAAGEFSAAESSCREARQLLTTIPLLKRDHVRQLQTDIDRILQSEELTQGLAGMILVDGRYLAKNQAEFLLLLDREIRSADALFQAEKWAEAIEKYRILNSDARRNGQIDAELLAKLENRQQTAELMDAFNRLETAIDTGKWSEALQINEEAKAQLALLPAGEQRRHMENLASLEKRRAFGESFERAETLFAASDWDNAAAAYRQAQGLAPGFPEVTAETLTTIQERLQRTEMYTTIGRGNAAFARGAWSEAITAYQQAANLLEKHQDILSTTDSAASRSKLGRIILQAAIIKNRQDAANALQNNDLQGARHSYQNILQSIAESDFAKEEEFAATKAEFNTALETLDKQIALSEKENYLKERFRELFVANYPATSPDNLINPQVTLSKETATHLIFRMQCTESGRGRPLTLVMYYAYDKGQKNWNLYTDNTP